MRILYITGGRGPDYLNDTVFHGLRTLFGNSVVDSHCLTYMYKQYTEKNTKQTLYGKGFTLYGTIEVDNTDRTDLFCKIKNRYYDIIIYGSVWRCLHYLDYVIERYPRNRIVFLDGEDETVLNVLYKNYPYFKRELIYKKTGVNPISLSIPEEKILKETTTKEKLLATIIPGDKSTYVFDKEIDYYSDYAKSYYGLTKKKGGWDCLRHYEILGSYCMPLFEEIEKCPNLTLHNFPKQQCKMANSLLNNKKFEIDLYFEILNQSFNILKEKLTTKNVAEYILKVIKEN